MKKKVMIILAAIMTFSFTGCQTEIKEQTENGKFTPALDTEISETLDIAGFMGNFEALDQVINGFNEIYPNVVFNYDHNTAFMLGEYLDNNTSVDIFMTNDQNIKQPDETDYYIQDRCMDLSGENIDVSSLVPEAVKDCTEDGKLLRLPIMMNSYGIVVNKSLLKKEGLSVPENYKEFLETMKTLKEKGYTPLQGSDRTLYGDLMSDMVMNLVADNKGTAEKLEAGDEKAADVVKTAFERLEEIIDNGYTDYELNCTYPEDNYDGSIMAFFEGNMPFYVCNTECVSGMKKRESKSEAYSKDPFEYEFIYAPTGDTGAYGYVEPWYGFSVNKDSDNKELATEFLRYMITELDTMAEIKGMPSVVTDGKDERYSGITDAKNIQEKFINDGSVPESIRQTFAETCNDLGAGQYKDAEEAAAAFVKNCAK